MIAGGSRRSTEPRRIPRHGHGHDGKRCPIRGQRTVRSRGQARSEGIISLLTGLCFSVRSEESEPPAGRRAPTHHATKKTKQKTPEERVRRFALAGDASRGVSKSRSTGTESKRTGGGRKARRRRRPRCIRLRAGRSPILSHRRLLTCPPAERGGKDDEAVAGRTADPSAMKRGTLQSTPNGKASLGEGPPLRSRPPRRREEFSMEII